MIRLALFLFVCEHICVDCSASLCGDSWHVLIKLNEWNTSDCLWEECRRRHHHHHMPKTLAGYQKLNCKRLSVCVWCVCVCKQSFMGVKALGWSTTICHPCTSHSVTVYRVQASVSTMATSLCPVTKAGLFRLGRSKRLWPPSHRGMSEEGNHRESERAREECGWMTVEQLFPLVLCPSPLSSFLILQTPGLL